jgi:hypothetical protein
MTTPTTVTITIDSDDRIDTLTAAVDHLRKAVEDVYLFTASPYMRITKDEIRGHLNDVRVELDRLRAE